VGASAQARAHQQEIVGRFAPQMVAPPESAVAQADERFAVELVREHPRAKTDPRKVHLNIRDSAVLDTTHTIRGQ
jgi:hypothetical protein